MKILYVSNLYGDNARGGAEKIVAAEARAMAAAGHEVAVVRSTRQPVAETRDGSVRVLSYVAPNLYFYADDRGQPYFWRLAWHLLDITNRRSADRFAALLAAERPDVVHTHNLMGLGFMLPAVIRREQVRRRRAGEAPLRHVHTVHDVQLLHPSGLLRQDGGTSFAQRAYVGWLRALMGSPDVVLFPSDFLRAMHERHRFFARSDRRVLANPAPAVVPSAATGRAGFLFVGQVEPHKGVRQLLDVSARGGLDALTVVGDGSLLAEVRAAGVTAPGRLTGAALDAAYDAASFVVVPSTVIENQPTVILEAFSRGVPVVASATGGIPELVREGVTGFLCAPRDVASLAAALGRARALDPEGWARMSEACRAVAAERGPDAHMRGLREAYR